MNLQSRRHRNDRCRLPYKSDTYRFSAAVRPAGDIRTVEPRVQPIGFSAQLLEQTGGSAAKRGILGSARDVPQARAGAGQSPEAGLGEGEVQRGVVVGRVDLEDLLEEAFRLLEVAPLHSQHAEAVPRVGLLG